MLNIFRECSCRTSFFDSLSFLNPFVFFCDDSPLLIHIPFFFRTPPAHDHPPVKFPDKEGTATAPPLDCSLFLPDFFHAVLDFFEPSRRLSSRTSFYPLPANSAFPQAGPFDLAMFPLLDKPVWVCDSCRRRENPGSFHSFAHEGIVSSTSACVLRPLDASPSLPAVLRPSASTSRSRRRENN